MLGSTAPKRVSRGDNSDLSAHIAACLHELVDQGYAKLTIDMYRGSLGHFSYWATRDKIKWRCHEEASIRRFLTTHLPSCDCIGRHQHDRSNLSAALLHLLRFLRTHRHTAAHTPEADTIEAEVQRFDAYLDKICGLAPKTRRLRRDYVRRFLTAHFVRGPIELTSPRQIRQFITGATKGSGPRVPSQSSVEHCAVIFVFAPCAVTVLTRCRLQCPLLLSGGRPHYRGRSPRLRSIASLKPLIAAPRKASAITPWHSAWLIWDCVSEKWQGSNWKISIGTEARCD